MFTVLIRFAKNAGCHGYRWLILNTTDPANELQWLISVLQEAESKREKVRYVFVVPTNLQKFLNFADRIL